LPARSGGGLKYALAIPRSGGEVSHYPKQIAFVLGLLLAVILLFATEKLPIDVITLLSLAALVLGGVLTPAEAFAGFSSDIIIVLGSIFVLSAALQETGLVDAIGTRLAQLGRAGSGRLLLVVMGTAGAVSAFMNNTSVTAVLMPPVIGMARTAKLSSSRLLMPLAFASILGGTCTLIGTSTNIAVSGYIERSHLKPLGLFEITPIGLVILGVGITYMMLIGRRLLPDHLDEDPVQFAMREYLSELVVLANSPLIGQPCGRKVPELPFGIVALIRGQDHFDPGTRAILEEGDTLLVEGKIESLMKVTKVEGVEFKAKLALEQLDVGKTNLKVVEALVTPQSELIGATLKETNFRRRHELTVLAIHRHGQALEGEVGDVRLRLGDVLLIEGPEERVQRLRHGASLLILGEHERRKIGRRKSLYAAGAFAAAVLAGGLGWAPLSVAFLSAALATVLLRCLPVEKARSAIDLRLLLLIGGMTAFGVAMEKSGAAALLAHWIVAVLSPLGVTAVLAGFFLVTILLTQPMSNAAAALVVVPVALSAARELGVQERTFAIAVMLAASISFIAPFEPASILVYGPGRYRFVDFLKVGGGLTLLLAVIVLLLVPVFWPLY
jgi:di/tricarboxylate transporter